MPNKYKYIIITLEGPRQDYVGQEFDNISNLRRALADIAITSPKQGRGYDKIWIQSWNHQTHLVTNKFYIQRHWAQAPPIMTNPEGTLELHPEED